MARGVTRRLFDRRSAFFAAALFAGLGSTQFLGALATYDPLALCLLALGTWLAVIAAHPGPILADDGGSLLHFYLGMPVSRIPVADTFYISYRGPGQRQPEHGLAGYADTIRHRYLAVVVLQFTDNQAVNGRIWHDLSTSGNYHIPPGGSIPYAGDREFLSYVRNAR
jgi:hypothetical protein